MYKKRTILEVQDWAHKDMWQVVYIVEHVPEPGDEDQEVWAEQSGHCFPKDIFEWRAAEYNIDPNDMDTLIDIVLAEPFLDDVADFADGERLQDAPDIATAREAHKARCARAKLRARIATRSAVAKAEGGLLHKMRTESYMDPEVIEVKREHVRRGRKALKEQRRRERKSGKERARELRKSLFPREENDG